MLLNRGRFLSVMLLRAELWLAGESTIYHPAMVGLSCPYQTHPDCYIHRRHKWLIPWPIGVANHGRRLEMSMFVLRNELRKY